MGRQRSEQISPDLFSMDASRDASTPPPSAATNTTTESEQQRHVLPKNLPDAVKHLSDGELTLLHAATSEEMKRRGRLPPGLEAAADNKTSPQRQAKLPQASLTRGQINAVRAAFKAGITPSRIARQFGISQSNVRKALAINEPKA